MIHNEDINIISLCCTWVGLHFGTVWPFPITRHTYLDNTLPEKKV